MLPWSQGREVELKGLGRTWVDVGVHDTKVAEGSAEPLSIPSHGCCFAGCDNVERSALVNVSG